MDKIAASADQDNVVLTGYVISKDEYTQVDKLASSYGKGVFNSLRIAPPHERQVRLQVKFVEVDRTRMQQAGFNFLALGKTIGMTGTGQSSPFQAPSISSTSTTGQSVTVNNPMNLLLFSSGLNIGAAIEDLESKNVLQILAEPTINALSGHKARFLSGGMFPYPMVQGGTAGQTSVTVQFMPYGVKLEFEPYVLDDGTIRLHVAPEVSALDYTNEVQIAGLSIPAMATRSAETDIELRDGQTFMLSGLLDHRVTDAFQKMPGISSIPILGQLFRSKNVQSSTTDLLVIVTPTIVDPLTMPQPAPVLPKVTKPFLNNDSFDNSLNAIRKP
jgi:pilus assembly protein CpaC